MTRFRILEALDAFSHKVHLHWNWLCDRWDLALGMTRDELQRTPPAPVEVSPQDRAYAVMAMPYAVTEPMESDEPWFFATIPGLTGCWGCGDTPAEALADLRESVPGWCAVHRKLGLEFPAEGTLITAAINADPDEADRLRKSREQARNGECYGR